MSRETDLAWCAGFFDGEGWVGAVQSTKMSEGIRSLVAQKDRQALDRFHAILNFGVVAGPYRNKSPVFYWRISKEAHVRQLFTLLQPYLGPVKLAQFQTALDKYDARINKRSKT